MVDMAAGLFELVEELSAALAARQNRDSKLAPENEG